MIRGRLSMSIAVSIVAGCLAVLSLDGGSSRAATSRGGASLQSNRAAARLDVASFLAAVSLPPGAVHQLTEPDGDAGFLRPLEALVATSTRAVVHAWWRVPGAPGAVIAHLRADPPDGATLSSSGSAANGGTGASAESVSFTRPAVPGVLGARVLSVTVTALPGSATGVLAQAQSDWIVPRQPTERIPAFAHEVDVTSTPPGGRRRISLQVTAPRTVRRLVALIDAMPVVQPGVVSCPSLTATGARVIILDFRRRAGGPLLAQASYFDHPGLLAPSGPCEPVQLSVGGRRDAPLIGGYFVRQAQHVLGATLVGPR